MRGWVKHDERGGSVAGSGGHGASMGSWLACFIIIVGFTLGGIALVIWNWPMFWVGVGIIVAGCVVGKFAGIMEDVTEYGGSDRSNQLGPGQVGNASN